MLGLLPRLLQDFVEQRCGITGVAAMNEAAGLPRERVFRIDADYANANLHRLLRAAIRTMDGAPERTVDDFAQFVFDDFRARWPAIHAMFGGARDLLEMLPHVYRALSAVLLDEEDTVAEPALVCERRREETLLYCRSKGAPPRFLAGFAEAAIRHYGEAATVTRPVASARVGAGHAIIIGWSGARPAGEG